MWIIAVTCTVVGIGLTVAGLYLPGVILIVTGVAIGALAVIVRPIVRASARVAQARGLEVNRLTGAPKMRSTMQTANRRMATGQAHIAQPLDPTES